MNTSLSPVVQARGSFLSVAKILLSLSLLCTMSSSFAEAKKSGVHEAVLKNGMKILVKQDKRAPIAVIQVWYKIGTSYEHEGITGLSHALEHMMFKGTKKH